MSDTMEAVRVRIEERFRARSALRLVVLERDCPGCELASEAARGCRFFNEEGTCRFVPEMRRRAERLAMSRRLRACGVPSRHWQKILEGQVDEGRAALRAAQRILAGESQLVFAMGTSGSGKSFAGGFAIAHLGGLFVEASALDALGDQGLLAKCYEESFLVLNDVGAGRSTSNVAAPRIEEIICTRWDWARPTMITGNLTQEDDPHAKRLGFWSLYGGSQGRIADRLSSDPVGWVTCIEESFRKPFHAPEVQLAPKKTARRGRGR